MLITIQQLEKFSGAYRDADEVSESLREIYIGTATEIIDNYVGYPVEEHYETEGIEVPSVFKLVCLEIASLIQMEESENLGINSKSGAEIGQRTFLNVVDYTKYLQRLSVYRKESTAIV